jgi:hypothetical protein
MAIQGEPPITVAEFKRDFNRIDGLSGILFVGALLWSQHQLRTTAPIDLARIAWFALPLPFLAFAAWRQLRSTRRLKEMERQVTGIAAMYALGATVVWNAIVGQANAAFTLDQSNWGYQETWFFPLLFFMVAWVLVYKRLNPR